MRAGQLWTLPIRGTDSPFIDDGIGVMPVADNEMVGEARRAMAQLALVAMPSQNPKTSMRQPGWIALDQPPTHRIERINAARAVLAFRLEQEMDGMQLAPSTRANMRGKLLRSVIPDASLRHTFRKIQAFDASPLLISFIWAGNATSHTIVTVAAERERLLSLIKAEAMAKQIAPEDTGLGMELRNLDPYRGEAKLMVMRKLAPHPRALLYYERRGHYDAMIHANLPLFFYCAPDAPLPAIRALPAFDPNKETTGKRGATRMTLVSDTDPNRKIYLYQPQRKAHFQRRLGKDFPSTYATSAKK